MSASRLLLLAAVLSVSQLFASDSAPVVCAPRTAPSRRPCPAAGGCDDAARGARRVTFFGPPGGDKPFSQLIAVSFYAKDGPWRSASAYVASQALSLSGPPRPLPPPGALEATYERPRPNIHGGPRSENGRVVALETPDGFYALEHAWPLDAAPDPAFDAFRASFKPAAK